MAETIEVIALDESTWQIDDLLDRADDHAVILKRDGHRYRLLRDDEPIDGDIAARLATLHEFAGFLSDQEAAEMKEYLRRGREEGSRHYDGSTIPGGYEPDH